ncbi:unnamed protein product [Onchocerca flexuosa]|uniref:Uncharacterized protein n=1 Tax=Onchocerca flexuosa TaxID=387005 RepID=A0A183GY12_9BILA|nr:unnamed protein product [Onchocerca flexuosa]
MLLRIARGHKMTSRERKKGQGREVRTRTSHKIERQLALATTRNSPRSYNVRDGDISGMWLEMALLFCMQSNLIIPVNLKLLTKDAT